MNRELDLNSRNIREAIEEQLVRERIKPKPVKALEAPVLALPHTAIYKMHRYYARRPHNVFAKLIEHYTNPGDIILDPFCGGGVTVVEGLKLRRRVIGVDINPLATWITKVEVEPVDLDKLETEFKKWYEWSEKDILDLYRAKCTECGKMAVAEWFEWSTVVKCSNCEKPIVLGEAVKLPNAVYECTNKKCKVRIKPDDCEKLEDKMISVYINCPRCSKKYIRAALPGDIKRAASIAREEDSIVKSKKLRIPKDRFPDMNSVRENNLYAKGFLKFRDFFTPRQRISLGHIKKWVAHNLGKSDEATTHGIIHIFSALLRYSNKLAFRSQGWQGGNPIEWAGHIYWPPEVYVEMSPLPPMLKRYRAFKSGKHEQSKYIADFYRSPRGQKPWEEITGKATCWLLTQSAHELKLPDRSVDAVITDPPFGGNVQYGELSDFYLVWIKEFLGLKNGVEKDFEAIETRHQGFAGAKDRAFYEEMLFKVFKECRRVIKPDGWLALTFHNKDVGVWMAMNRAAIRAGFRLPPVEQSKNRGMIYQPPIQNYTQTIHQKRTGSMLGDFILSFRPAEPAAELDAIRENLSSEEEKELQSKCEEIIRFHGGADETTLMTGLIPYLSQSGLLARVARFDLRFLLTNGPFVYNKPDKKWYLSDMMREGSPLTAMAMIPAEEATERLIYSHLSDKKQATLDDLLVVIYSQLVNSYRPQMSTIDKVLTKYCKKRKPKGQKRDLYIWDTKRKTPDQIRSILETQLPLTLDLSAPTDHNTIIATICQMAANRGLLVHVGESEQKKSPLLAAVSIPLSGMELGLPQKAFKLIKEIDLIILKDSTMLAAIEVTTTISTFNKAVNDRFRNLITIAPNLNISLNVLVREEDFKKAHDELYTPANVSSGLAVKVNLNAISKIDEEEFFNSIVGHSI
jgi:SAM-dependent methyltransferase